MTRESAKQDHQSAQPRYGRVTDYDPDLNLVKCAILPETTEEDDDILTGWLQIVTPMVGPGWGIVCPIEVDDQVILLPVWNGGSEYVVLGGTFNDEDLVAQGPNDIGAEDSTTQIGEYLIRSKTDFTMKFVDPNTLMIKGDFEKHEVLHIITKGTDVDITASDFVHVTCDTAVVNASTSVTVNSPDTIINGHLQVNGSINATGDVTDRLTSMENIREIFDIHIHDDSPVPIPQMPK
jgi:phage baseplate assembly protein gpV